MPCLRARPSARLEFTCAYRYIGADDSYSCASSHDSYQRTLPAGTSRQSPDRAGFPEGTAGNLAALVRIRV